MENSNESENTDIDAKVLDLVKTYSTKRNYQIYKETRHQPNFETVRAIDDIPFHAFSFDPENLAKEILGSLTMKALRCLERPFPKDDAVFLTGGAMQYALGKMADDQHSSLKGKTAVLSVLMRSNFNKAALEGCVTELTWTYDMENPFDKELLLLPSFHANGCYLAVVKNPRAALRDLRNHNNGHCDIYYYVAGNEHDFERDIPESVNFFLEECAERYENGKIFKTGKCRAHLFVYETIEKYDKPLIILSIMEEILMAEREFPNMRSIGKGLCGVSFRDYRRFAAAYRNSLAELVRSHANESTCEMVKYLLNMRSKVIEEHQQAQREAEEAADLDIIVVD